MAARASVPVQPGVAYMRGGITQTVGTAVAAHRAVTRALVRVNRVSEHIFSLAGGRLAARGLLRQSTQNPLHSRPF